jgi:hypothetical protein
MSSHFTQSVSFYEDDMSPFFSRFLNIRRCRYSPVERGGRERGVDPGLTSILLPLTYALVGVTLQEEACKRSLKYVVLGGWNAPWRCRRKDAV